MENDLLHIPGNQDIVSTGENLAGFYRQKCSEYMHELFIRKAAVVDSLKGIGVSKALLAHILAQYPDTENIGGVLAGTNASIWLDQQKAGKTPEEALLSTPAYKIREALGFSKVEFEFEFYDHGEPLFFAARP